MNVKPLSKHVLNCLEAENLGSDPARWLERAPVEMLRIPNFGRKRFAELRDHLVARGYDVGRQWAAEPVHVSEPTPSKRWSRERRRRWKLRKLGVLPPSPPKEPVVPYCSFCGKSQHEVGQLFAGPRVFICDECVEICRDDITQNGTLKGNDASPRG